MAKLTTQERNNLPASTFAGPGRSFPIPDKSHARNALARVGTSLAKGHINAQQAATIRARAKAKLGK